MKDFPIKKHKQSTSMKKDFFILVEAIAEAKSSGEQVFQCPICGGHAEYTISDYNGHLHAWCSDCQFTIRQ